MAQRSTIRNLAEYLPARLAASVINCFPPERNLSTCDLLARAYSIAAPRHTRRAMTHLQASFPEWDQPRLQRTAHESIRYLFQLAMVDAMTLDRSIRPCNWHRRIDLAGVGDAMELIASDGPLLLLTGHCGNWELLGYALSVMGYPMHALARPLDNPLLNHWLLGIRQAWGLRVLTKWGATPEMQRIIQEGGRLGFIADQNAGDSGVFVPFFGRLASAYKSIALLAMHHDVPIIVATARRQGQTMKYELVVGDIIRPADWADQEDPLYYVTARYTHALENLIRQCPAQYLWMHRRWKSRPKHVLAGRSMPASLARRISSLPWHSSSESDAIIEASNREALAH